MTTDFTNALDLLYSKDLSKVNRVKFDESKEYWNSEKRSEILEMSKLTNETKVIE